MAQERVKMIAAGLAAKGYVQNNAVAGAYLIISGSINQQASFLTYKELFLYLGIIFLILIPLLMMFKDKKRPAKAEENIAWGLK